MGSVPGSAAPGEPGCYRLRPVRRPAAREYTASAEMAPVGPGSAAPGELSSAVKKESKKKEAPVRGAG